MVTVFTVGNIRSEVGEIKLTQQLTRKRDVYTQGMVRYTQGMMMRYTELLETYV